MQVRLQSRCSASADALMVAGLMHRRRAGLATVGQSLEQQFQPSGRSYCVAVGYLTSAFSSMGGRTCRWPSPVANNLTSLVC